jgi:hypothetical protein
LVRPWVGLSVWNWDNGAKPGRWGRAWSDSIGYPSGNGAGSVSFHISVDLLCDSQPDERGRSFPFPENTTANMLASLSNSGVFAPALSRLPTFDTDLGDLSFAQAGQKVRFAFVDTEHTNQAVFRDWLNVSKFIHLAAIVAFHYANLVFDGLENIQAMLRHRGGQFSAHYLPDTVFVLALGNLAEVCARAFADKSSDRADFIAASRAALQREIAHSLTLANTA